MSVVVLNWNGKKFIDGFLQTFARQNYPMNRLELLFVDNLSSDNSVEYFESAIKKYSKVNYKVVQTGGNFGYAGGNNRGMSHTAGDYILVCNNDLEFDSSLISELVQVAQEKHAAITVPKLMYLYKKGIINNAGSRIDESSHWPIYEIGANEKDKGQYDKVREITAFCGACVLFARDFLHNVGMFDDKFFMYFEDGDLSWRGQKAGYKYYYVPKAIALHHHTGTSKEGSPLFNHFVGRNRLLILTKNGHLRPLLTAWGITLRDHLLLRLKSLWQAMRGKYPKKQAVNELWRSQRMLWAALLLTPYAICKRLGIIGESKL